METLYFRVGAPMSAVPYRSRLWSAEDDIFLALAKHVPALSSPVGGNAVLDDDDKCIDMNDSWKGVSRPNGWGRSHPVYGNAWLHSDMKGMAYFYVFKLYSQLVEKGDLQ